MSRAAVHAAAVCVAVCACAWPAGAPLIPIGVCEALRDLPAYQGKSVAVLGRYSYRENGSAIEEQACEPALPLPSRISLETSEDGPRPEGPLDFDTAALNARFADIRKRTSLGRFRFGTPDYDRWAIVYGRLDATPSPTAKAPANLAFRGDGVVVYLTTK